jgi:large subunit ribosomal protein L15
VEPRVRRQDIVNLDDLNRLFKDGDEVTVEALVKTGIIPGDKDGVKILGFGELSKKLTVRVHRFSKSAIEAIKGKGGEAVTL